MSKVVSLKQSILANNSHEKSGPAVRSSGKPPMIQKKRKQKKRTIETIRRDHKLRRRAKLASMSEGERRQYLDRETQMRRDKKPAETIEQTAARRLRQAERLRESRANAKKNGDDKIQRLRDSRASESDIQKAMRRQRNAEQMRIRRANMTEEEAQEQREKQAQRMRDARAAKKQKSQDIRSEDNIVEASNNDTDDSFLNICNFLQLRVNMDSMKSHSNQEEQKPYDQS